MDKVRTSLKNFPLSLPQVYEHILLSIPEAYVTKALNTFLWLAFAERLLYLEEVAEAAILDSQHPLDPYESSSNAFDVVEVCSKMVVIYTAPGDGSGRQQMSFAHSTVKEYLMSAAIRSSKAVSIRSRSQTP
jgi:hypothetical protein